MSLKAKITKYRFMDLVIAIICGICASNNMTNDKTTLVL